MILLITILSLLFYACHKIDKNAVEVQNTDVTVESNYNTSESIDNSDTSSNVESNNNDDSNYGQEIQVDKSKIVISDEADFPYNDIWQGYTPNSYVIAQTQSYENKWFRKYAAYYPRFTDEIKHAGSEAIKQYYADFAEKEYTECEKFMEYWGIGDTVTDAIYDYNYYCYKTYYVDFFKKYLSVGYSYEDYCGGVHGLHFYTVDNFDMNTGKLLTLDDLFGNAKIYRSILNNLICKNLLIQYKDEELFINPSEETDIISYAKNLQFQITDNGIEFIFQIYEIAQYAAGTISVTVPYEELSGILQIQID